jgi:hypothetical protein
MRLKNGVREEAPTRLNRWRAGNKGAAAAAAAAAVGEVQVGAAHGRHGKDAAHGKGAAAAQASPRPAASAEPTEEPSPEASPTSSPAPSREGSPARLGARASRRSKRDGPHVLAPGLNLGRPDVGLYQAARLHVLEREAELAARHIPLSGASKYQPEVENEYKCVKHYHYLFGKVYDLREFYDKHPGGEDILRMSAGLPDATALFESYHAFAARDSIVKRLLAYEVTAAEDPEALARKPAPLFAFEPDGFYHTLVRRVRREFGATAEDASESLTDFVKADNRWAAKVGTQMALNAVFLVLAFALRLPTPAAMLFAFLAGWTQIQWGFTAFHDASHFAVGSRNHWANAFLTRLWAALSLWEGRVWMLHHAVLHHSYTGSPSLDPDVQHAQPMVRKTPDIPARKDNGLFALVGDRFGMAGWAASAFAIYVLTPGMWLGQARVYLMYALARFGKDVPRQLKTERLWGMPSYAATKGFDTQPWERAVYVLVLLVQLQRRSPLVTLAYFVSLNLFYSMCIVADHDLAESAITNHVDFEPVHKAHAEHADQGAHSPTNEQVERMPDWGAMQVRNTTNFMNSKLNLFGRLHGNINWQASQGVGSDGGSSSC